MPQNWYLVTGAIQVSTQDVESQKKLVTNRLKLIQSQVDVDSTLESNL